MRDRYGLAKVGNFGGVNGRLFLDAEVYWRLDNYDVRECSMVKRE